jgi:hypothetical protein
MCGLGHLVLDIDGNNEPSGPVSGWGFGEQLNYYQQLKKVSALYS